MLAHPDDLFKTQVERYDGWFLPFNDKKAIESAEFFTIMMNNLFNGAERSS